MCEKWMRFTVRAGDLIELQYLYSVGLQILNHLTRAGLVELRGLRGFSMVVEAICWLSKPCLQYFAMATFYVPSYYWLCCRMIGESRPCSTLSIRTILKYFQHP